MENNPSFHLQNVVKDKDELVDFEGPLNVILLLLQKNKIEIRDIKISEILDQYLGFLAQMEKMDLEVTSEFIQMASYLLLIKTKELLASDEEVTELDILMESLEQLKAKEVLNQIKAVAPELGEKYKTGSLLFSKKQDVFAYDGYEYEYRHDPLELLNALKSVLLYTGERVADTVSIDKAMPHRIVYPIHSKSRHIISRLKVRNVCLKELYAECATASEIVATFVSVLELCSHGNINISHSKDGTDYELSFAGGNIDELMEKLENEYE